MEREDDEDIEDFEDCEEDCGDVDISTALMAVVGEREGERVIRHISMNEARGVDELQALEDVDGQLGDEGKGKGSWHRV